MENAFNLHQPQVATLSNWDFADVSATSVEFRFWAYGTNSIYNTTSLIGGTTRINNIAGNDLILNGTVTAVPEPSTLSMIGLGLFGMWHLHIVGSYAAKDRRRSSSLPTEERGDITALFFCFTHGKRLLYYARNE
jgi:hypothetical protein